MNIDEIRNIIKTGDDAIIYYEFGDIKQGEILITDVSINDSTVHTNKWYMLNNYYQRLDHNYTQTEGNFPVNFISKIIKII